ncbi:DUF1033 family protein [Ureibacillus sp. 179-F W5.1 NHS]|uniref:DUF1033 family protein n=1 Tax=Bacillales TaxID=1385 RepID=UPI00240DF714|nr:DUF1033 family protein [Lysinibacillus halotolerans]
MHSLKYILIEGKDRRAVYQLIYMKADYEPWWKFEGWESNIVLTKQFQTEAELKKGLQEMLQDFRSRYEHEANKEGVYYAFWTDEEREYCDACDDDIQIYHGIIVEKSV